MLKNGTLYQDLGANHFDNRAKGKQALRLVNRLQNPGFNIQITPVAAEATVSFLFGSERIFPLPTHCVGS